jgi:hypothetical protein
MERDKSRIGQRPRHQQEPKKGSVNFSFATPARVEEIIERTGTRGEATQVRCRLMDARQLTKSGRGSG